MRFPGMDFRKFYIKEKLQASKAEQHPGGFVYTTIQKEDRSMLLLLYFRLLKIYNILARWKLTFSPKHVSATLIVCFLCYSVTVSQCYSVTLLQWGTMYTVCSFWIAYILDKMSSWNPPIMNLWLFFTAGTPMFRFTITVHLQILWSETHLSNPVII